MLKTKLEVGNFLSDKQMSLPKDQANKSDAYSRLYLYIFRC